MEGQERKEDSDGMAIVIDDGRSKMGRESEKR